MKTNYIHSSSSEPDIPNVWNRNHKMNSRSLGTMKQEWSRETRSKFQQEEQLSKVQKLLSDEGESQTFEFRYFDADQETREEVQR